MIFVDTNVVMYAVGREHPLREESRAFFVDSRSSGTRLATSAEVLQELLHAYLPVGRLGTLDAAWTLAGSLDETWTVEVEDVALAKELGQTHAGLGARDLVHLACCQRRKVAGIKTYDRGLAAAWD